MKNASVKNRYSRCVVMQVKCPTGTQTREPYRLSKQYRPSQDNARLSQFANATFAGVCDAWHTCLPLAQAPPYDLKPFKLGQVTVRNAQREQVQFRVNT